MVGWSTFNNYWIIIVIYLVIMIHPCTKNLVSLSSQHQSSTNQPFNINQPHKQHSQQEDKHNHSQIKRVETTTTTLFILWIMYIHHIIYFIWKWWSIWIYYLHHNQHNKGNFVLKRHQQQTLLHSLNKHQHIKLFLLHQKQNQQHHIISPMG